MPRPNEPLRYLRPILTGATKARYLGMVALWAAASGWFWQWWLRPEHVDGLIRYGVVTALIGWVWLLQLYFVYFFLRAVRSSAPDPVPGQYRVAMVVTKTPSEPFAILRRTLEAMLAQDYPHDTWLADEDPSPETIAWCAAHQVRISCRKGREDYHQPDWPRRTRCKEGNLAFFYDHWGYAEYDIVSQLDADHVPQPGYLREMLRPFIDPGVGYVSAPSICASNAADNWSARTRLYTEGAFHGILQAGYSNGFAPMCIGSHYAVRTKALQQIGGLGPELAEDHSTTLMMNAGGWRGVHALDAIAIGDGPATVTDMVTQEFQWSRSLVTLLLQYTPALLPQLPLRLKAQFLFCQLLYLFFAVTLGAMYLVPIIAVIFDLNYAEVTYPDYIFYVTPMVLALLIIATMIRADGLFRPQDARVISWEKVLFVMLQWPWVAWGCIMAVRDRLTGRFVDFRITPKGEVSRGRLPFRVIAVHSVLALGCIVPVLLVDRIEQANGFYVLTLFSGLLYVSAVVVTVLRHMAENGWRFIGGARDAVLQFGTVASLIVLFGLATSIRLGQGVYALQIGLYPLELVTVVSTVSGFGNGAAGQVKYRFDPSWN